MVTNPPPTPSVAVIIDDMARTVLVSDPNGGSPFRCTRTQFARIHQPKGLHMIEDENGAPVGQKAKTKPEPKPTPANTEE